MITYESEGIEWALKLRKDAVGDKQNIMFGWGEH